MSAGIVPEGLEEYMGDVQEAATQILQSLGDYDPRVEIPAVMMALVFLVRGYVEEGRFANMDEGMKIVRSGMEALKQDHIKDMQGMTN